MSPTRHAPGSFCWAELATTDAAEVFSIVKLEDRE